ncbi:MAG: RNA-binding transcriptional accessory protein, partial [Candidatus Eremiobacteraeota bacterium]|nr:RNA-binding transcriptional accessory protein [Candidatus Eremiobacteraeota bacterium]
MNIASQIATDLKISTRQVESVLELLDEGCTIPFLARYRKERTGGLDEEQLRQVAALKTSLEALESRRQAILKSLEERQLLSPELQRAVLAADNLTILEDIYLPHRPKRKTRASAARELGLEPLARKLVAQPGGPPPQQVASEFVGEGVESVDKALAGARDIVAEWAAEDPEVRATVRAKAMRFGRLLAGLKKGADDPKQTYRAYYDFSAPVSRIQPHQVLAIDRGEREKVLKVGLELAESDWREPMQRKFRPKSHSPWSDCLREALEEGAKRLLLPAIEREVRKTLTETAQEHAIAVFATNLESLLLVPPLAERTVLGLDPGFRTGCKVAVVDPTGKLLDTDTIYPHPPQKQHRDSLAKLRRLVERHGVTLVAIGNGTASRETEMLVTELVEGCQGLAYLIVSEAGASVYSASPLARAELPELDVSLRGAVSIARRVLDPLAELIKIDPKSVGVGMYQHDLEESKLDKALAAVVESVVHRVGVELNTASPTLLSHLGGIGPKTAERIVAYRDRHGAFRNRASLLKVQGLGPKAFEQAAGFIRVRDGDNPLDATAIHPESYAVAERVLQLTKGRLESLGVRDLVGQVDCPEPTLTDIVAQLKKPSRDPRLDLPAPILRREVMTLDDLEPGLRLKGTVRNVVDFGAFVDLRV